MTIFATLMIALVIILPNGICCNQTPPKPIVGMHLSDTGMHRELTYSVQFADTLLNHKCEYVLEQQLPAGVYVSVDQLDDLKRLEKLNAIYPTFVDIESSTEKSKPFTILLKGQPRAIDNIKIPIHYRYHAPSKKSIKFATVEIPIPKLYIKCIALEVDTIEELLETASKYKFCLNESGINFLTKLDDATSSITANDNIFYDNCEWYLIDVHFQLKSDLRADIPIGNAKSFPPILYALIILSWIASLYTVFRTNTIPHRINYKLEEQRILQNKIK